MLSHLDFLERNVEWRPSEPGLELVDAGETVTWAAFDDRVNRLATALADRGVRKGDRVAMVLFNTVEFPTTLYACYKIGAVPVPINFMLATGNFRYIFDDVHPTVVVYDAEVAEAVEAAATGAVSPPDLVCVGASPSGGDSYEAVFDSGRPEAPPRVALDPGDPSYVLYTSGTTGAPKGVTYSGRTAYGRTQEGIVCLGLAQDSVALQLSPWFHAGGVDLTVHPAVAAGSTMVVTTDWEPGPAADTIEQYSVTHVVGVPTIAQRIANLADVDERDLSTLECLMCMGSPLSRQLAETLMESVTPNVYNGYGTSETLLDAVLRPEDLPEHAGTVGRPAPDMEVRVIEFDRSRTVLPDETVPPGEEGEIVVRGDPVMDYYFGNESETRASLRGGWYYTDDLGVVDEDGYLTVTGRADDMILSGGELVSPIEVEETLEEHAAVEAALVVGRPDEEWGEVVTAYVVGDTDAEELDRHCRDSEGLADFKRPREYEFVDDLERTATGKKQRYRYRD
jgi:acyl-CoA synthetase (AMP-forming)/AMP-acid ligase II